MELTPVLRVSAETLPERVLVVGDPARAALVAERFDDAHEIGRFREYHTYVGVHHGVSVAVTSHGVGAPGAAICFEELGQAGARRIIRAGTCGGLSPDVVDGDLVIATGAIREDGLTSQLVPPTFPAVASIPVIADLTEVADRSGRSVHCGIVLTQAVFYSGGVLGSQLEMWQRAGAIAVEMECAALFVIGSLRGMQTGAVLAVDGNPLLQPDDTYDPHRDVVHDAVDAMISLALDALVMGEL